MAEILSLTLTISSYLTGNYWSTISKKNNSIKEFEKYIESNNIDDENKLIISIIDKEIVNINNIDENYNNILLTLKQICSEIITLMIIIKRKIKEHRRDVWLNKYRSAHVEEEIKKFFNLIDGKKNYMNLLLLYKSRLFG